jgi:SAM-dependent methyltransferase
MTSRPSTRIPTLPANVPQGGHSSLARELSRRLAQIQRVFDVAAISRVTASQQYVQRYYKTNRWAYSLFHTRTDRMYIGISRHEPFTLDDLLEAARTVQHYLVALRAINILELGTGRGATAEYIARRFRHVCIDGIDISPGQLTFAFRRAKAVKNYVPAFGDFHDHPCDPNRPGPLRLVTQLFGLDRTDRLIIRPAPTAFAQSLITSYGPTH